jgi:SAM-dependent methyltransferase|tara:strand:+ start:18702 stop:19385 length:684 start_codon:yes stop_codon:yes gene_type:complete
MAKILKPSHLRGDFVFKEINGKLEFIGDFNGLYTNDPDPWDQSATTSGEISYYHSHSRQRLIRQLKTLAPCSILEIGCGLGYTTKILQDSLPNAEVTGMDISDVAITKASKRFPQLKFLHGDIRFLEGSCATRYDVVILNQLLWYILKELPRSFKNCEPLLTSRGKVVISQAFPRSTLRYGTEICSSFQGLIHYLNKNIKIFNIKYSDLDKSETFIHDDGLITLQPL